MVRGGCVYIVANQSHSVLYIGVTSRLLWRVIEHRERKYCDSFTSKYKCFKLVYYEFHPTIIEAIIREKQMKKWKRAWKIELIVASNPNMLDLYDTIDKHLSFGDEASP